MGILLITAAMLAGAQDAEIVEFEVVDGAKPHVMFMQIAKTREETAAKAAELFDKRDADGNGYLEGEERSALNLDMPHVALMRGNPPMPPAPPMPHRMKMEPGDMFAKIDTNGDGSVSKEEFEAHHKDHCEHVMPRVSMHRVPGIDAKREVIVERIVTDGEETREEVIIRHMGDGGEWNTEHHKVMLERVEKLAEASSEDADGDGRVSRQEAIDKALERFDAMDKDGDGTLGEDENVFVLKRAVELKD